MSEQGLRSVRGYELVEQIGEGGFGAVYRAFQPSLKREVALKVILPKFANQPDFIRRFEVEAELVARLEHPYIVPLFDYWREPDSAYLVLRLLRGGSLRDHLDEGAMTVERAATVLDQIASALSVAHRNGVVHRDIKPENILLDEDGNAFLTDFGIAKTTGYGRKEEDEEEEGITGSIPYTPPEQLQSGDIHPQTDIYALGIVLYEMLAGEHPFHGATVTELIFKQIQDPVPDITLILDDLPLEVNDIIQKATAKETSERYEDVRDFSRAFQMAIAGDATLARIELEVEEFVDLPNPYKGLRAFQEADADDFFGRDELIGRLLSRMQEDTEDARFLAVLGPSGSGKSSVVKAGLVPRLRRGGLTGSHDWFVIEMFPGTNPFTELESALMRVAMNPVEHLVKQVEEKDGFTQALKTVLPEGSELVLVIDQFEELFTMVEDEDARSRFLENLVSAIRHPNAQIRIIVTMRADFYDKPLQYREFGELLRKRIETVLPMSPDEIHATITLPAEQAGAELQSGLVEAIAEDVGDQPGMLPLLQYTLTELFEHREGQILTLAAYHEIGGVTGSLARRSEEIYTNLDNVGKRAVRQLFLRLVTLGEGTEDTRRRVRRSEAVTDNRIASVIDLYGKYRLLTFDKDPASREPTVEVAHEALIRTWENLRSWINESREDLRIQRRVTGATNEWLVAGRDASFLASGARLSQFEEWRDQTNLILNEDEQEYLDTSIRAEADRKAREAAIARRVQNFQRASIILGIMVALAIVATGIFLNRATQAQAEVRQANETLTPAQSTVVAAQTQAEDSEQQAELAQETIVAAQDDADQANLLAQTAQAQVEHVAATLTPIQATIAAGDMQLAARQSELATAQVLAGNAQTQAAVVSELTAIAPTVSSVNERVAGLEAEILSFAQTLTPAQSTLAAAQAQVTSVGATLTPVQLTIVAGDVELAARQSDLATAQVLAGNAQTQAAVVSELTAIAPTLNAADARVASLEEQVESVGLTLTPAQATVIAAQEQIESVGLTLTPIQAVISSARSEAATAQAQAQSVQTQADSISLAVNAEQAIVVGDYDLALALTLHSLRLNPEQARARRILNEIAFGTARLSISQAKAFALSPDNRFFAVTRGSEIVIWDVQTRQIIEHLTGHSGDVLSLDFNATSTLLATGSADATIQLWDISPWRNSEPAQLRSELSEHTGAVNVVKFSPATDIPTLLSGSEDTDIIRWAIPNGSLIQRVTGNSWPVVDIRFVGEGGSYFTLVDANETPILLYWNLGSNNPSFTEQNTIYATYNRDSTRAIIGGSRGRPVEVFNTTRRSSVRQFGGRDFDWTTETATAYALRPGGRDILIGVESSTQENRLVLLDIASGAVIRKFEGESAEHVEALAFNPDGSLALSAHESVLVLWDVATGRAIRTLAAHTDVIEDIHWSIDGRFAISRSRDDNIRVWDIAAGDEALRHEFVIESQINRGKYPGFNSRGDRAYVAAWTDIFNWDVETTQRDLPVFTGAEVLNMIYSPVQPQAISVLSNTAVLWNLDAGINGLMRNFGDSSAQLTGPAAYSQNGDFVAFDDQRRVLVYQISTGSRVGFITKPTLQEGHSVAAVAVDNDGERLVIATEGTGEYAGDAGQLIMMDVASGTILYELPFVHTRRINSVVFSANGEQLLTASDDNTLLLWALGDVSAEVMRRFAGHTDDVNKALFIPAEPFVISASDDRTMILWDIESGQGIRTFRGNPAPISGFNISPDGRRMITSYGDLTRNREEPVDGSSETWVYIWELSEADQLINWTRANRYVRNLTNAECNQYGVPNCQGAGDVPEESAQPEPEQQLALPSATSASDAAPAEEPTIMPDPTQSTEPKVRNVGAGGINVRGSDSTSANVVSTLQSGEDATIIGRSTRDTRWLQIRLENGRIGWVRQDIIQIAGDVSNLTGIDPPPIIQAAPAAPTASSNQSGSSDNTQSEAVSPQANIQITGLGLDPSPPSCGQGFNVMVNLTNSGAAATSAGGGLLVIDRYAANGAEQVRNTGSFPILEPGQNWVVAVPMTVSTYFSEAHQIVAIADVNAVIPESNDNDNSSATTYTLGQGGC